MLNGKRVLGIVPARGGSKRVPRKNIKLLGEKPLIAYAIQAGLNCPLIDKLIVSTDDQEIADIAKTFGAEVPFLRPADISGDLISDQPVAQHALDFFAAQGESFDYVVWLRPTTPFKLSSDIVSALETLEKTGAPIVRSVSLAEGVFHPYWMYRGDGEKLFPLMDISLEKYIRSQDLPKDMFRLNGVVDAFQVSHIRTSSFMYAAPNMGYIVIPQVRATDIDEPLDFAWAEFLLTNNHVQL